MAAAVQQPVSAHVVGNAFVQQYYQILHKSPGLVFRFYQDISKLGRPEDNGTMGITTTMNSINEKILSLNYGELRAEIKSVDAQESFDGGVHVLVTGYLTGKDNVIRNFAQTFFLAPQDRGYFVLNDIFRYVEDISQHDGNQVSANEVEAPLTPELDPSPVQENHISEQTMVLAEVANGEEVYNPPDNGQVPVVEEEEEPIPEVVDEIQDGSQMIVASNSKIEEVPKKSYASIVMHMKESVMPYSSPAPAPRKSVSKSPQPSTPAAETTVPSSDVVENVNNQDGEADGFSIYIKGLPFNATPALLEEEFKRFGPIRSDGIQVRSNRQGFCFGFVEFEMANAVQNAIEASPIMIGGRQAYVEEKRSTNSRVNSRVRLPNGRGSGFRNEGVRGRGNYGGGRGYSRGEFNGRTEFGNRGGNRGGFPNRGGEGYQRTDSMGSNGSRMNRASGMAVNGTAKTMAPQVSATA
ncbi:nuclear transport factor 2-like isoform X2 [Cornus florida]|uniref:nuclear transport factor 2-like isoform X2 n=1 Tax=Cornus florida TaxID=4283 RepID=UPI00289A6894|nr:nuclear transport factor 2-like isoform X2 [Cornus florida]